MDKYAPSGKYVTAGRIYHCPVEVTMEVIGGKWTPVLLAHLKEGVRRFGELHRLMPDVSEKMLVQRLRELERAGLVARTVHPGRTPRVEYDLTDEGRSLGPALQALYDWGRGRADREGLTVSPVGG
ncbi:MAG TPA: helix-turn-helix domain-containing protein [Streptosporangiaceae bacterium]|jgi:DNA-binding HxlR family transcriptional regulator